jgi:hypothetical protein
MVLVSDKNEMDGPRASDCKKDDGPDAIRTHDLRRVKAEVAGSNPAEPILFRFDVGWSLRLKEEVISGC